MELKDTYRALGRSFAEAIIAKNYDLAHSMFAPWLAQQVSAAALKRHIEAELQEVAEVWELAQPMHPRAYEIDWNQALPFEGLQAHDAHRRSEPRLYNTRPTDLVLSPEVTKDNYRIWMVVVFLPLEGEAEFDAYFDMWMAVVEVDGQCKIGYFELADPD